MLGSHQTRNPSIASRFARGGVSRLARGGVSRLMRAGAVAALLIAAPVAPGAAETAGEFYKGKSVAFIVASGAGGGYDLYARMIARHYPKYLAGNPGFVVQNMPGASGVRAMNYIYNVAAKDGSVIGMLPNFSSLAPFYKVNQAKFDSTKFNWIGSPSQEYSVFVLWHSVPFNSVADAKGKEIILGSAGASGTGAFYARVLGEVFGLKFKLIQGYGGLGDALLAMERGEIQGYPSVFWNTLQSTKLEWIQQKKIKFLVQWGKSPDPELKSVPYAGDLAAKEDDKRMIEIAAVPLALGRPVAAAPGVPGDRLVALRSGLRASFKDAGYHADCRQQKLDCSAPVTGEELAAIIAKVHTAPEAVRERLIKIYQAGRKKKKKQ